MRCCRRGIWLSNTLTTSVWKPKYFNIVKIAQQNQQCILLWNPPLWSLTERTSHRYYWWHCSSTQHNTGIFKPLTKNIRQCKKLSSTSWKPSVSQSTGLQHSVLEVQQMPWDTQYKRLPPAAGSTSATHGGYRIQHLLTQQHPACDCSLCVLIPQQKQGGWRIKTTRNIKQTHFKLAV